MILEKFALMKSIKILLLKLYYWKSFLLFIECGKNVHLGRHGTIIRPSEIKIGENVYIGEYFNISARNLKIGNNIMIGPNVLIECDNHCYSVPGKTMFSNKDLRAIGSVTVEDDVWIGANVTILPNSIIAEGSVIGAGSIVTKPLPPYSICVGSPCKSIKTRFSSDELRIHLTKIKSKYSFEEILVSWKINDLI
jgi:acetyltransferase-like isoleucine patch superfamily enzyme